MAHHLHQEQLCFLKMFILSPMAGMAYGWTGLLQLHLLVLPLTKIHYKDFLFKTQRLRRLWELMRRLINFPGICLKIFTGFNDRNLRAANNDVAASATEANFIKAVGPNVTITVDNGDDFDSKLTPSTYSVLSLTGAVVNTRQTSYHNLYHADSTSQANFIYTDLVGITGRHRRRHADYSRGLYRLVQQLLIAVWRLAS